MDREMDGEICGWILEFLVRKSVDDTLLKELVEAFPHLDGKPRLKKTLLLHSIRNHIRAGNISENILDELETIERLDRIKGLSIPESMKQAYCAVALECTAKYLPGNWNRQGKYLDAVNRIWRDRMGKLETSGSSELLSEELRSRRRQVEDAVNEEDAAEALSAINTRNEAVIALRRYVSETLSSMGPPKLEKRCGLLPSIRTRERENGLDC